MRLLAGPPPTSPWSRSASPARPTIPVTTWRRRLRGGASFSVSSRIAATGGTLVARTAGMRAATSVTPMPTDRPTTIVRVASCMPPRGIPHPAASKSAPSPRAKPRPHSSPRTDAVTPRTKASAATAKSTWRRVAPMERISANSRLRWATEIEKVLKMMKAPTRSAAPEKASSAGVRKLPMLSLACLASSAAVCSPVLISRLRGRAWRRRATSSVGVTPGAAAATARETLPSRRYQAWTSAIGATISVAPPIEATLP